MIRLTIHENNTGTIDFQTEEDLREWIKDPEMKEVEWDYADYEVFNLSLIHISEPTRPY